MIFDKLIFSIKNLSRKKYRNTLTVTSIAIGVASVVLIASVGDIGKFAIDRELSGLGIDGVTIGINNATTPIPLGSEELGIIMEHEGVENAIPIVMEYSQAVMRQAISDTIIWGIGAGARQVISLDPMYGRLISRADVAAAAKVCVVDQNIAQAFFKRDNIVGKKISLIINGVFEEFDIVGVTASGGAMLQGLIGEIVPSFVYIPYSTLQELTGKNNFSQIAIKVSDSHDSEAVGNAIIKSLDRRINISNAYKADNIQHQKQKLDNILSIITFVLSAIAGISLIVAGLGIMTVMLVSVSERKREIGIKKSIGANKWTILSEFISEAFILSFLGSVIGASAGMVLVSIGCIPFDFPIIFNTKLIAICVAFSVITGITFGAYPAVVASRMNPVDALREE